MSDWLPTFGSLGQKVFGGEDPFDSRGTRWAKESQASDEIAPVQHPVDGQWYNSKSAVRRVTKAAGLIEADGHVQRVAAPKNDIKQEQIAEAFKYARDHLRDQTNLRNFREQNRDRLGRLRDLGIAE